MSKTTENTPLPDLLEEAARGLRDDPNLVLSWGMYDGKTTIAGYPHQDGQVWIAVSERQFFRTSPEIATRLGMQLLMAAGALLTPLRPTETGGEGKGKDGK